MVTYPRIDKVAFGQNAEDIVLVRALSNHPNKVYVDVGAGHPIRGSVTKNLHDILSFSGVEIEPIARFADLLRKERARSVVFNCGAGESSGIMEFYECTTTWALSTFDEKIYLKHSANGLEFTKVSVDVKPLDLILEQSSIIRPGFALLKIDAEGMEQSILNGFNIQRWLPSLVLLETIEPDNLKRVDSSSISYLLKNGYSEVLFDGINSFFVRDDCNVILRNQLIPSNKLDYYIPLIWWRHMSQTFRSHYKTLQQDGFGYD